CFDGAPGPTRFLWVAPAPAPPTERTRFVSNAARSAGVWTMWIAIVVVVAIAALVVWLYNRLVQDRNQVAAGWSDVDVQLQRRHDLVPMLVETVRGYAGHEAEVLRRVVEERHASRGAARLPDKAAAEDALGEDLRR